MPIFIVVLREGRSGTLAIKRDVGNFGFRMNGPGQVAFFYRIQK
jgi:hypothetical protein